MKQLPFILRSMHELISEGHLKADTVRSPTGAEIHRLQFEEHQWPRQRPEAFTPAAFKVPAVAGEALEQTLLRSMLAAENAHKLIKITNTYRLLNGVSDLFFEIKSLKALYGDHLDKFDTFTQPGSRAVEVFFIRPECSKELPKLLKQAAQGNQDKVFDLGTEGMYRSVAVLSVPLKLTNEELAAYAFNAMQDANWADNPEIIATGSNPRMASMGDVFSVDDNRSLVACKSGFRQLERFWPSGAYEHERLARYGLPDLTF